jgi:cytidylate kinase
MNTIPDIDHCISFIHSEIQPGSSGYLPRSKGPPRYAVTLSRETGSGAHMVARHLADYLGKRVSHNDCPWTVFDRNLVETVIEEHHLPPQIARFMTEDRVSELTDTIDALFALHPSSWSLVRHVSDTIYRLCEVGNVVIIGRAGNLVTSQLPHVLHVRLIAPLEKRIESVQQDEALGRKKAIEFIKSGDLGRERYVRKYFHEDIDDPLLYHLVLNTDLLGYQNAARIIGDALLERTGSVGQMKRIQSPVLVHTA